MKYNFWNSVSAKEIKDFREYMGMTQKELANFMGVSKPTVERWEKSNEPITGAVAMVIGILTEQEDILNYYKIPEKKYRLRMWYMYKNRKCTLIDVDTTRQRISVKNYVNNIHFRAFGSNNNPTYLEYEEFLKSRCFPETRDKMKIQLDALNLPFYEPMLIIKKTQGRMAEDDFWILIEE